MAAPALLSPEDGAEVGSLITFTVQTSRNTTIFVRPMKEDRAPVRLVVLPDTQFYTTSDNLESHGDLFSVQTEWIAENAEDVAFVTHLGDIVQDWDDVEQWAVADAAMSMLDDVVPYGLVVGNHDFPTHLSEKKYGLFNDYFPISRFDKQPWWGGGYPDGSNNYSYQTFSSGGLDFLILHLHFEPDELARQWASDVIAEHPDHRVIISTHSFLGEDGEVWIINSYNPIETIWADLVEPYENVFLILSAHRSGEARRTDYIGSRPVHQLLACYQAEYAGGGSQLRLLDFIPEDNRIDVSTYAPLTDEWEDDSDSAFSLDYAMSDEAIEIGSGEPESGLLSLEWTVPESGAYEWFAETDDGERTESFAFTADADPPLISDVLVSGLASKGIALITWSTNEPATGSVWIDGEAWGETELGDGEHMIELKELPAAFEVQIFATDVAGNVSSTKPLWTKLGQSGAPADSGSAPPTADDTGDTGQLASADCGGCRSVAGGGGCFLWLLVLLRRAATRGSESVS